MEDKKLTTNKIHPVLNDQASVTTDEGSSYTLLQDVSFNPPSIDVIV